MIVASFLRTAVVCGSSLLALVGPGWAQAPAIERTLTGIVVDADAHAPVAGASLQAGAVTATTDDHGRFTMTLPAGAVTIVVRVPGYFPLSTTLDLTVRDILAAELTMVRETTFATSVAVVGAPPAVEPAAQAITPVQVLRTPGALDNVFRTLQTLPAVAATDEFGSRLSVRGGAPDQNLTVMDGVEIHDPYRLFGLTSAFNPETIQRFELSTGGFGVAYGDRLSSLLVVENRDGAASRRLGGSASLSITDANVVAEGRLPHDAGSWLVTGRRTYYDVVAARVTGQDFPGFADVQAKGVWAAGPGRRLTAFGLSSRQSAALEIDEDTAQGEFQDDTDNDLTWLRFETPLGARAQSHTVVAYSDTRSTFGVDAAFENSSQRSNAPDADAVGTADVVFERGLGVKDLSLRQEVSAALGTHVLALGLEAHRLRTAQRFEIRGDRNPVAANGSSVQGGAGLPDLLASSRAATRGGAWIQDSWQASRVSVQAGLRLDRVGITRETLLSPRLSIAAPLDARTTLKAAVGRYTQSPGYEKQLQGDYVLDLSSETAARLRSEQAIHGSLALERALGRGVTLRAEGYYKRLTRTLIGRREPEAERLARVARYDFPEALAAEIPAAPLITTVPVNDGRGRAYGVDVYASRLAGRLTGWASYTWGRAERHAYGLRYPFEYDRRHAASVVSSFRLTPSWEIAATTRVASGFPRTAPLGVRVAAREDSADADADGLVGELVPARDRRGLLEYVVDFGSVGNLNRARLPVFARVDGRATWRPGGGAGRWELYLEVLNVLGRKNAGALGPRLVYDPGADRPALEETRDQSIPRLPTLGVRVRF